MDAVQEKKTKRIMAWRCPNCGRIYRGHVFTEGTHGAGPVCNTCAVPLEWVEVEVAAGGDEAERRGSAGRLSRQEEQE